ncbi:hypothetical protein F4861DRAFT_76344 [Xylaria intraflava]|nr:hypothetical protein F4861DRAFT_76344 [Xylaria intraflava]
MAQTMQSNALCFDDDVMEHDIGLAAEIDSQTAPAANNPQPGNAIEPAADGNAPEPTADKIAPELAPTSFHYFSRLPQNIRKKIFQEAMAMEAPRLIHLRAYGLGITDHFRRGCPRDWDLEGKKTVIDGLEYEQAPPYFFVNREVRVYATEFYNIRFTVTQTQGIPRELTQPIQPAYEPNALQGEGDNVLTIGQNQYSVSGRNRLWLDRNQPIQMEHEGPASGLVMVPLHVAQSTCQAFADRSSNRTLINGPARESLMSAHEHIYVDPEASKTYRIAVYNIIMSPNDILVSWYTPRQEKTKISNFNLQFSHEASQVRNIMVMPWAKFTNQGRCEFDRNVLFMATKLVLRLGNWRNLEKIFMRCKQPIVGPFRYADAHRRYFLADGMEVSSDLNLDEEGRDLLRYLCMYKQFYFMVARAVHGNQGL